MKSILQFSILSAVLALLICSCSRQERLPSLDETFDHADKIPFGTYVMYEQLKSLYHQDRFTNVKTDFSQFEATHTEKNDMMVSVSKYGYINEQETNALLRFVYRGNTAFISSTFSDSVFLHAVGLKKSSNNPLANLFGRLSETAVLTDSGYYANASAYSYYYHPFDESFEITDSSSIRVLGRNKRTGLPNFVVYTYGKGRLFIHSEPRALSNYFLLHQNNLEYLKQLFAFTNDTPSEIYWDDYYPNKNFPNETPGKKSGLGKLLRQPNMKQALWLLFLLAALYLGFGSKRRQRIVPTIPSNKNTTVAFTETIGRLYLKTHNNRNMADKMILHFQDHIRTTYYMNSHVVNEAFLQVLSRKSNIEESRIRSLFKLIGQIHLSEDITDEQLMDLNIQLAYFYKNKA